MKVFLDTNILVDLVENRQESAQAAVIHQLGEDGRIQLCASYLSYANLGYIWRKVPQHQRYERIRELCVGIDILPMDVTQLHAALTHEVKDYEDMLQYQCALEQRDEEFVKTPKKSIRRFLYK